MKSKLSVLVLSVLIIAVAACQDKQPLEKAGERADEIIDNVKDGDPILHKKGTLEKAGEAVDESLEKKKK
jgi:hypothetical protein